VCRRRPPGGHSTPRTTSGSRAASAAGVAEAACLASLSRRSLGLGAAILREFVRPPSGPPLRVASERPLCLPRQVGCILLGGPPVTTAAAGPVDRRLFGLVGGGVRLGSATSGQWGSSLGRGCHGLRPWHRRRSSPGRPPGRRGRALPPGALRPPRGHGAPPRSSIGILVSQRSRRLWRSGLTSTRDDPVVAKPRLEQDRYKVRGLRVVGSGVSRRRWSPPAPGPARVAGPSGRYGWRGRRGGARRGLGAAWQPQATAGPPTCAWYDCGPVGGSSVTHADADRSRPFHTAWRAAGRTGPAVLAATLSERPCARAAITSKS
jgi:hypothetical protein